MKTKNKRWGFIIFLLIIIALLGFFAVGILSLFIGGGVEDLSGNAALIPIKGVIMTGEVGFVSEVTTSDDIIEFIEKAEKNPSVKAIVFEIDSPGGGAVASEEIANKIKEVNKTTVAWIRGAGASGAYWIASATDHIVANRMSITGSIGVISSYLEFAGFLGDHNITYQRLVAGKYKDLGSPLKELTLQERRILEKKLDIIHDYFIEAVAENRGLSKKDVEELSTGAFYLGVEAKAFGLVDELGGKDEVIEFIEKKLNMTVDLVEYKHEKTLFDLLKEVFNDNSFLVGKGIGSSMFGDPKAVNSLDVWT